MDKEDALRVYERLEGIERTTAKIEAMMEDRQRECDKQQDMVDELRKRVNILEQAQAKNMGGITTALAMVTSLASVGALIVTLIK